MLEAAGVALDAVGVGHLGKKGTQGVLLSGNSTEPLLYPRIDEVIRAIKNGGSDSASSMFMRLYSNFYYGEKVEAVADVLNQDDYVRVSLDAGSGLQPPIL